MVVEWLLSNVVTYISMAGSYYLDDANLGSQRTPFAGIFMALIWHPKVSPMVPFDGIKLGSQRSDVINPGS